MAQEWYYAQSGQQFGPVSASHLKHMADAGLLQPTDLVWKKSLPSWIAANSLKGLFSGAPIAPAPLPAQLLPSNEVETLQAGDFLQSQGSPWEAVQRHLLRAFAWDLDKVSVSPEEQAQLTAAGLEGETIQRYLCWRRSLLFAVILPCFISAILSTISVAEHDFEGLTAFGALTQGAQILAMFSLPIAALVAAALWTQSRLSRRIVIGGWAVGFVVPILVALCPLEWVLKLETKRGEPMHDALMTGMGILIGIAYYVQLMPTVLSLIPGMLRGCVRIKTLLPESILPGWFLVAGAPLYALLLLVTFIAINQMIGNVLLMLGVTLLLLAPLLYVARAGLFVRPLTSRAERREIAHIQWVFLGTVCLAVVFLLIYLFTKKIGTTHLVGFDEKTSLIRPWKILQFYVEYLGRSLFITVLAADLLLRANRTAWASLSRFAKTDQAAVYDQRMSQLERVADRV